MGWWWTAGGEEETEKIAPSRRPPAGPRGRILIVEDDEPTARILRRALELEYEVHWAADGDAALAILGADPDWDLVITDIVMPGTDGIALGTALKRSLATRAIPVFFMTGEDTPGHLVAAIGAGARRYLSKPLSLSALEAAVRSALGPSSWPGVSRRG